MNAIDPDVERLAEEVLGSLSSTAPAVVRALAQGLEFAEQPGVAALGFALGDVPDAGPDAINLLRMRVALKTLALDSDALLERIEDAVDPPWAALRGALLELRDVA